MAERPAHSAAPAAAARKPRSSARMIEFRGVSKLYAGDVGLDQATFAIDKGEFVFLVGSTGSGKSTVMRLLIKELEPTSGPSPHEYRMPGSNDDVVSVIYLPHTSSTQAFQHAVTQIREATKIMRVFTYNRPRAMTVRGTADQIAMAQRMAKQLAKP